MVNNPQDAEDIYQDVFMKAYRHIKSFRFQSNFYTWLYRIAVRCAVDYRKKRRTFQDAPSGVWQDSSAGQGSSPEDRFLEKEFQHQVQSVLDSLPLMQRAVFYLRFVEGFQVRDVAEIVGSSTGSVKRQLHRGVQKARKRLWAYGKE
jgi:RNA polymerase sigma-70 factor (ECF subfamily)